MLKRMLFSFIMIPAVKFFCLHSKVLSTCLLGCREAFKDLSQYTSNKAAKLFQLWNLDLKCTGSMTAKKEPLNHAVYVRGA